ncbi:MAG: potassium transporter KtrB [Agathobacter sp.]|nr:potassium transporter KtrB [Agathobacter sp.]
MKRKLMTTTRVIMLGFFLGAMLGSLLLYLPVSLRQGIRIDYIDSLFVAVSSMCVTGLSTVNIGATFSGFGQVVLLLLIQMGGLGIVTFTTLVFVTFQKRITLADRMLMQNAYNLDTLSGLVKMTLRIVRATMAIELIGAILYAIVFVPQYGPVGIWYAVFHAVSAFCNAGIDLLGGNSLCAYRDNVWINLTTMFLIIAGGLGFPVYWELARRFQVRRKKKMGESRMSFQARLVIVVTIVLLVAGTVFTMILEYDNPATLGKLSLPQKLMASMFQSVTLRTAGFATIDQSGFTSASCLLYLILMFIGGSPAGTAGGVKTVTVTLLLASVLANIRGEKEVSIMHRKITDTIIRRCVAIIIFSLTVLFVLTGVLLAIEPYDFLDTLYEMTSAIATVGLSRGMTATLGTAGKLIVALAMYLGRIGPITLALAFNSNKGTSAVSYPEGKVIIG